MHPAPELDSVAAADEELASLRASFPQFHIWLEAIGGRRRYVARPNGLRHPAAHGHDQRPRRTARGAGEMTGDEPGAIPQAGLSQPSPGAALAETFAYWREAWRIRRAHPKWCVQWVASARQYQAFRL
jgi:hypothetical protein